jgi:DNA-binding transcriptional LysR family regulator
MVVDLYRRCQSELHLELVAEEFHTPEQPDALRSARVDIGICHATPMTPVEERGIRRERLLNDELNCALVAASDPLAQRSALTLRDLTDVPFLFMDRGFQPGLYDQVYSAFRGQGFSPRVDQTYIGLKTVWSLVAEGRGWAVAFQSQCSDPPPGTVAVPVAGLSLPWGVDLLYREDESRTTILMVVDMLHEIARAHEVAAAPR